ncbi:MAG: rhamnan synthesis F family protein [Acetobacter sp.]|nr:rhamnan synthesis F family protein [Acetobacter sp.]
MSTAKLAVILHLYYKDQLPTITKHLNNLTQAGIPYDLYITSPLEQGACTNYTGDAGTNSIEEKLPSARQFTTLQVPLAPAAAGDKFCEMTADVPQKRGAYIEVRDPIEKELPSTRQFTTLQVPLAPAENRGYDIAPFISTLQRIPLSQYQYILKLHTKNNNRHQYTYLNHRRLNNQIWSNIMWNALLGSPKKIRDNFKLITSNPQIGILAPEYCLTNEPECYRTFLPQINKELRSLGFPKIETLTFAAGTMFLARTEVLLPLLKYQINDFPPTDGNIKDGTLAHVIERLFGAVAESLGYTLHPIKHKTYHIARFFLILKRFFYQKKQTNTGKTLIKICKIPIRNT